MPYATIRRLSLATAGASYLLVLAGGLDRALGTSLLGSGATLEFAHRMVAVFLGLIAASIVIQGRKAWAERPAIFGLTALLALMALPATVGHPLAAYYEVAAALLATLSAAVLVAGGERPYHSQQSMFRSQWQVPLFAGLSLYVVTVLGTYLKSLGAEAACKGWPLCQDLFTAQMTGVAMAHLAHRIAVLLAGLCLVYTVYFVWRKHQHRPALLVGTGAAVILYTTQVLVGAQAARAALSPAGGVAHLAIAAALICTLVAISALGYYSPSLPAIEGAEALVAAPVRPLGEVVRTYFETTKPRLVTLLLITCYAAMWVAAKGFPSLPLSIITLVGLFMSSGAANALNMWYDTDIDAVMKRTQKRPIPSGRLTPSQVLAFGVLMGVLSFILLAFATNLLTAYLSLAGLLFYVCIYTMWLKRSTDLNTVIGGACGAVPPMIGWVAVTGNLTWAPIIMFLLMFAWQPPHFWALALYRNEDYRAAKIPMLPVTKGERHTKWQILIWTVLMFPTVVALYWTGVVGQIYLWVSVAATVVYLGANLLLFRERLPEYKWARKSFFWSIYWLAFVFLAMVIDIKR